MLRPTDQETTAIEDIVGDSHRSQEKGHVIPWRAAQGSIRMSRRQRKREKLYGRGFIVVSMGRNGRGRISRIRIA